MYCFLREQNILIMLCSDGGKAPAADGIVRPIDIFTMGKRSAGRIDHKKPLERICRASEIDPIRHFLSRSIGHCGDEITIGSQIGDRWSNEAWEISNRATPSIGGGA